jgi:hypothetical protein
MANAALCRFALELANGYLYRLTNKSYNKSSQLCPLLINGDDCVFKGNRGLIRPLWEGITAMAGLESSVGKTYFSEKFCTINSTLFTNNGEQWIMRKCINMGLVLGRSKSGEISTEIQMLGSKCKDLKNTCPPSRWPAVKSMYIKQNWQLLNKYPLPWFLPEWFGGLGLPLDNESELSRQDRLHATIIRYYYNSDKKQKMRPIILSEAPEWQMHQLVMRRLKKAGVSADCQFNEAICDLEGTTYNLHDEYSRLYKALTIELLFTHGFYDLWELPEKKIPKSINHNLRVFDQCTKLIGQKTVDPFSGKCVDKFIPMKFEEILATLPKTVPPVRLMDFGRHFGNLEKYFPEDESE